MSGALNETVLVKDDLKNASLSAQFLELQNRTKAACLETIHILTKAAEYKDNETGDHIRRIGVMSGKLAIEVGMEFELCEAIRYASPMHDIGKIGIPESILLKTSVLSPQEFEMMKQHTLIGHEVLKEGKNPIFIMAQEIALSHHEHWDGTGYPHGLKGEQIPLSARIVTVVDHYDALRSSRAYRAGLSHDEAMRIIYYGDGRTASTHFDPYVLDVFTEHCDEFRILFNENTF